MPSNKHTTPIKSIIFDLASLTDQNFEEMFWRHEIPFLYASKNQVELNEATEIVFAEYARLKDKIGISWVSPEWWFNYFQFPDAFGRDILNEKMEEHENKISFYEDSLEIPDLLKSKFINMILCTNSTRLFLDKRFNHAHFKHFRSILKKVYSCPDDYRTLEKDHRILQRISCDLHVSPDSLLLINTSHDHDTHQGTYKLAPNSHFLTLEINRTAGSDSNTLSNLYSIITKGLDDLVSLKTQITGKAEHSRKIFLLCSMDYESWPSWVRLINETGRLPKRKLPRNLSVEVYDPLFGRKLNQRYVRKYGNVFLHERCTPKQIGAAYDMLASKYDETNPQFHELNLKFCKRLSQYISPDDKILDMGAGTGITSEELVNLGFLNITLMDISAKMLERASEKEALKNKKFLIKGMDKKIKAQYDAIVSVMAIHYYDNVSVKKILSRISSNLNDKGIVAIVTPKSEICHLASAYFDILEANTLSHNDANNVYEIPYFIGRKRELKN